MNELILKQCRALLGESETDPCENGALRLRAKASTEDFTRVLEGLLELGFYEHFSREEAGNRFADLALLDTSPQIHLDFDPSVDLLSLILTEDEALPPRAEDFPALATPLVTQVKLAYCAADCGMSYVIRLCDGRFVVIDGGFHEYEEPLRLLETLQEQNVLPTRPTVAAWFITHPHGDHFEALLKLLRLYGNRILIQQLAYNWPTDQNTRYPCDHAAFDAAAKTLAAGGCELLTPHTGQRLVYADATFDVLFACEDLYPEVIRNSNDTSLILRMEQCGRRVLWLADAEPVSCNAVCRRFPAESLACEILQVGHHGYGGGSPELYRRANPEILLWPCPDFWYEPVKAWPANEFLRESKKIQKIFVAGRYGTVIDMTAPVPALPAEPQYAPGDVIAAWEMRDFCRIIDLGWSCVTGGDTGYWGPELSLDGSHCIADAGNHGHAALIELLRPGLLQSAPSYQMELVGSIGERCEELAVLCNDPTPTLPSREKLIFIPAAPQQDIRLNLILDAKEGICRVLQDGKEIFSSSYTPKPNSGLYLYLKNAVLRIQSLRVSC